MDINASLSLHYGGDMHSLVAILIENALDGKCN